MSFSFKVIREDARVFLVYAGRDRKYLDAVRVESKLFLELPAFGDLPSLEDDGEIIRRIKRSNAIKNWYFRRDGARPSRLLSDYAPDLPYKDGKPDRSMLADLSNVKRMFGDAKEGDVAILTPHSHFDPLLIGEFGPAWTSDSQASLSIYEGEAVPYRTVRWLRTGLTRSDFPSDFAKRLQNRKAITIVDPDYYNLFYKFVYGAYIWLNESKIDILAPNYHSNDPTTISDGAFIIKWSVAAYAAILKGEFDQFQDMDIDAAARLYFDPALVEQMAQAFSSPGGWMARLVGAAAAALLAGTVVIATSDETHSPSTVVADVSQQVRDIDPDNAEFARVADAIGSLKVETVEKLKDTHGRRAKVDLGLKNADINEDRSDFVRSIR